MTGARGHAAIVGGGVVGAATAYYLLRDGWQVTILDQGRFGAACSHANCGYISPSHVLPLAQPGALWRILKTMAMPRSPVRLKPRIDPRLWAWLTRFALRCNERAMMQSAAALVPMLKSSRRLHEQLVKDEELDCDWQARGLLFVFRTPAKFEHFAHENEMLTKEFDTPAKKLTGEELTAFEPALKPGLPGAWLYECDAHLRPDRFMAELRRVLLAKGATILENRAATGLRKEAGRAIAVETAQGEVKADAFVYAAGAWTPKLSSHLGVRVPVQPGKGYSMTMARPARCPTTPMVFEEDRVAVTPFRDGYRLGSMMEFNGYDAKHDAKRLDILRAGACRYLHTPLGEPVQEEWWGWRPMCVDGVPIVGPAPAAGNVMIATGHSMLGLTLCCGTGLLVAELLGGRTPHLDPALYSPRRF